MQRLPLIVKTKRDSSRTDSRTSYVAKLGVSGCILLFLAFGSVACSDPDSPPENSERVEAPAEEDETPNALDRLGISDGDRSVAQNVEDASLAAGVQLALVDDSDLRAFRLESQAVDGQVVLQGSVETLAQRERAESVASAVEGVRRVINEIEPTDEPLLAESRDDLESEDSMSADEEEDDSADVSIASADESSSESDTEAESEESEATYHTVQSGDNLWDIARAYDVSIDQIRSLNNLGSASLQPGQRLQVK